jgi:HEPN domain-containing protein
MKRDEWKRLAKRWLVDAKVLLDNRRWAAAYYLAGYAVECGLKACILARVGAVPEVIFETRRFSENCWTHNVMELVKLAELEAIRLADIAVNAALAQNWNVAKDWSEKVRYKMMSRSLARKLFAAIADKHNGVMRWIKAHW